MIKKLEAKKKVFKKSEFQKYGIRLEQLAEGDSNRGVKFQKVKKKMKEGKESQVKSAFL